MTLKFCQKRRRWLLSFTEDGQQRRLSFATKQAARDHWQSRPNLGAFWLNLADTDRAEIMAAWQRCQDRGLSLIDCVVGANKRSAASPRPRPWNGSSAPRRRSASAPAH